MKIQTCKYNESRSFGKGVDIVLSDGSTIIVWLTEYGGSVNFEKKDKLLQVFEFQKTYNTIEKELK